MSRSCREEKHAHRPSALSPVEGPAVSLYPEKEQMVDELPPQKIRDRDAHASVNRSPGLGTDSISLKPGFRLIEVG